MVKNMAQMAVFKVGEMAARKPPCDSYGDLDGDGYIRPGVDSELLGAWIIGGWDGVQQRAVELGVELKIDEAEFLRRADTEGDGTVSVRDAQLIEKYAQGITDTFPVCPPAAEFDIMALFPRLKGDLMPRLGCLLEGPEGFEDLVACLFPRLRALTGGMT